MNKPLNHCEDSEDDSGCSAGKRRRMSQDLCERNAVVTTNNYVMKNLLHKTENIDENVELQSVNQSSTNEESLRVEDCNCEPSKNTDGSDGISERNRLSPADNENALCSSRIKLAEGLNVAETFSFSNAESSALIGSSAITIDDRLRENNVFSTSTSMETTRDLETTRSSADDNWTTDNEAPNEEAAKNESQEEDEAELSYDKSAARPKFAFVDALRKRQNGSGNKIRYNSTNRKGGFDRFACDPSNVERAFLGSLKLTQRLSLSKKLDLHDGCVNCLHFNSDGSRLASGSDDLRICVWDWARGQPLIVFRSGHRGNVFQAKFMPLSGDCHIVSCSRDGQVRLADLSTCNVSRGTRLLAHHKGAAHKLALLNDSPHVFLTCGEDGAVFEIDLREQKPNKLLVVKNPENRNRSVPLYSINANPSNSNYFAVSGRDNYCRVYDKRYLNTPTASDVTPEPVQKFSPSHLIKTDAANSRSYHNASITCLTYNHNGTELLASYNDDDIYLFDTKLSSEKGDCVLHRYTGHRNNATIKGVNFYGPNSEFVVSGSDCGYVYLWDRESEEIVNFLHADDNGVVNVLESHPSYALLATSGLDNEVKLWEPLNSESELDRKQLRKLIKSNAKYREADRVDQGNVFDAHMLSLMIARMRRAVRRRRRENVVDDDGSTRDAADATGSGTDDVEEPADGDSDDDGTDDSEDEEHGDDGAPLITCRTS